MKISFISITSILIILTSNCSNNLTGPSCVKYERIERKEVTTVNERLAFITIIVPAATICSQQQ